MESMQLLRDPNTTPDSGVIAEGLGAADSAYRKFIEGLANRGIQVDWRYYNDGKAWLGKALYKWTGARGGEKEMTVFWLSIWNGFFKVSLYIPEKARADLLSLPLSGEIRKMIQDSKQIGKLKFFPLVFELRSDEPLDAVYSVIEFRKSKMITSYSLKQSDIIQIIIVGR